MPKKVNRELKARAIRMVAEHRDYPSVTAAAPAVCQAAGSGSTQLPM
jgi:transposase